MKALGVLCLLLSVGCAGARPRTTFAGGSASWRRVQSEHFDMRTDLSEEEAGKAVIYLEGLRMVLLLAGWPGEQLPAERRLAVYVFANPLEFKALVGGRIEALSAWEMTQDFIVLQGPASSWDRWISLKPPVGMNVPLHELTHALSRRIQGSQPRWFAEGLAQFFETLEVSSDGTITLGSAHPEAIRRYLSGRRVTVRQLLGWDLDSRLRDDEVDACYGLSWVLVHWMYNTHPGEFVALQQRFARGQDPREAFLELFAEPGLDGLTPVLTEYVQHGAYREFTTPVKLGAVPTFTVEALPEADVHALRARLARVHFRVRGDDDAEGLEQGELDEALRLDPGNVAAAWQRAVELEPKLAYSLAQAAMRRHPEDGEAWHLLALLFQELNHPQGVVESTLELALEQTPDNPYMAGELAELYAKRGNAGEALALMRRALDLAPADFLTLNAGASVAASVGDCADAVELQTRALGLLPPGDASSLLGQMFREQLERYRAGCGTPAAGQ